MTFWKIEFSGDKTGYGWLQFNELMEAMGIFEENGTLINYPVEYHPVEFNTMPEWA